MDVQVHFKGGGSFVEISPLFSSDGESVFVCWKNLVTEYSTKTGKKLYVYKGPREKIIGINFCTYNSNSCLVVCSRSGEIVLWEIITHFKALQQQLPIGNLNTFHVLSHKKSPDQPTFLVSYGNGKQVDFEVVTLTTHADVIKLYSMEYNCKGKYYIGIGQGFITIANGNRLNFIRLDHSNPLSRVSIDNNHSFTCVAAHPSKEIVLTGDSLGRVRVWRNIFEKQKVQTVYHWHTLPVNTVCFSPTGTYFYSGADECVLVKWQLDNVTDRTFVPRIAAEIDHVTVSNNNIYVAVATRDNAVRIFDATLYQITLIQQLVLGKHHECGLIYDHRTKALIMNGNQGQVQFYSPEHMFLLYNVDIVVQNKITNERDCVMINTEVTKIAVSKCGVWLATVEERRDDNFSSETRLKFWKFHLTDQKFELNTSIEYPHEGSVNSIGYQPTMKNKNLLCVTVGDDEKFKIWQLTNASNVYKKDMMWLCLAVGSHRDLNCRSLSFSVDGSLMATAFGKLLTLWTPDTCELKCSLTHPLHVETIQQVQFGNGAHCHLVLAATDNQISAWNVLTLTMKWTVCLPVSLLVAEPTCEHMAVITKDNKVYVFSPETPQLIYSSKTVLATNDTIEAATFVPSEYSSDVRLQWHQRTPLYFVTSANELFCLGGNDDADYMIEDDIHDSNDLLFRKIQPRSKTNLVKQSVVEKHIFKEDPAHKSIKTYLEAPIHTSPPIRLLCYSLLRSLTLQNE